MVRSFGDEQYAGCTGYPADSHWVIWLTVRFSVSYFGCNHISDLSVLARCFVHGPFYFISLRRTYEPCLLVYIFHFPFFRISIFTSYIFHFPFL